MKEISSKKLMDGLNRGIAVLVISEMKKKSKYKGKSKELEKCLPLFSDVIDEYIKIQEVSK